MITWAICFITSVAIKSGIEVRNPRDMFILSIIADVIIVWLITSVIGRR